MVAGSIKNNAWPAKVTSACWEFLKGTKNAGRRLSIESERAQEPFVVQIALELQPDASLASRLHSGRRSKIRILVADDHFVVRMGLIAVVNTEPTWRSWEAAEAAGRGDVQNHPDIVLMDFAHAGKDGIGHARNPKQTTGPCADVDHLRR